ncbi:hypothetical protein H4582DRAFT_2102729 [Lactarius indigo]|nr:hypothetical protein H4582DRAFT_2102729 [Lactarius indigo]
MRVKRAQNAVLATWKGLGPPPADAAIDLSIALKPHNENALIDALYEVSNPVLPISSARRISTSCVPRTNETFHRKGMPVVGLESNVKVSRGAGRRAAQAPPFHQGGIPGVLLHVHVVRTV